MYTPSEDTARLEIQRTAVEACTVSLTNNSASKCWNEVPHFGRPSLPIEQGSGLFEKSGEGDFQLSEDRGFLSLDSLGRPSESWKSYSGISFVVSGEIEFC